MRRGATLLELLAALALASVLAAMALPGSTALLDQLRVEEAASALTAAHARAQLVAVAEQRVTLLTLTPDSLVLRAVESPTDTVERWRGDGPARRGVQIAGVPRLVGFAPSGVAFGVANGSYTLLRGSARKQVIVSRYGRVRVQ
jgi:prepilin-type N-terminal cleavage/methylation domain-containing protein